MRILMTAAALLLSLNSFSNTNEKIFLSYCSNFGDGVSYSYQSCVNRNFSNIQRELNGAFFSYCSNFGDEVSYSFTSCLNRNFDAVERELDYNVFLSYCSNFSRSELDFSFTSCVNSNYRAIERALQNREQ